MQASPNASAYRPMTPGMRRIFYVASGLVVLAGIQLYILTDHTDRYFAWTIHPGLTAAFLGAGYFAAFFVEFLAARRKEWSRSRIAVYAVLVFTVMTFVATILHRDKFHFSSSQPVAQGSAWAWLAVYTIVPILTLIVIARQAALRGGGDPPRERPLQAVVIAVLAVQGTVMLGLGAALFIAPTHTASIWPWTLTPLTARAIAAWLLGVGVGLIHAAFERDFDRVAPGATAYLALGVLQLVALARYSHDVDWGRPAAWVYLAFLLSILLVGAVGQVMAVRPPRPRQDVQGAAAQPTT